MNLADLELFVAAARRGSFAAVAKECDVDPSSVSRGIAALESALGMRLLQRTTRRMTLTEAGEVYLLRVEPLIEELARAREAATGTSRAPRGALRLTASVSFGQMRIVPLLPELRARYPDLKIECLFTDANVDLIAGRIDLAIRLAPTIEGDLIAAKLMDTHYRVVASPEYLTASAPLSRVSDITRHRCILFNLRPFRTRWIFRHRSGRLEEVPISGDLVLAPAGAIRDAALAGLGPALLPDWLIDEDIAAGRLVNAFPNHTVTATTFDTAAWLVYPSRAYLPGKVRVVIDFLRESMAGPGSPRTTRRAAASKGT
jgi:DNA-binding transcriptional LysR family regulator